MEMPKVTRRTFLKVSAGTTAAAAAAPRLLNAMEQDLGGKDFNPETLAERKVIPITCHVCNIQDGAIAFVENGRVVKLEGNPEHVSTRGRLCAKGNSGMWYSYDPDRILYPLKRVGARECYWIGPPLWKPDTGIVAVLKDNMGSCKFYDSSPLKLPRVSDGIHPTDKGGADWADHFWTFLRGSDAGAP